MLANFLLCALGGTLWNFQFFFYTMGESQMGRFGFSSWTLHMASIIIFGTLWGFALREAAVADQGFALLGDTLTAADAQTDAREALYGQGVAFTRFAREHPALFRLMLGPQRGDAGGAAIDRADDVLERRASELAPDDSAAAKLACRALVQGLAVIEASGRLAQGEDPKAAIRFFTDHLS